MIEGYVGVTKFECECTEKSHKLKCINCRTNSRCYCESCRWRAMGMKPLMVKITCEKGFYGQTECTVLGEEKLWLEFGRDQPFRKHFLEMIQKCPEDLIFYFNKKVLAIVQVILLLPCELRTGILWTIFTTTIVRPEIEGACKCANGHIKCFTCEFGESSYRCCCKICTYKRFFVAGEKVIISAKCKILKCAGTIQHYVSTEYKMSSGSGCLWHFGKIEDIVHQQLTVKIKAAEIELELCEKMIAIWKAVKKEFLPEISRLVLKIIVIAC